MNFNSETVGRIVRGLIGLVMVIAGIMYGSFIGFLGAFFLFGAITGMGGCGFGSTSCSINGKEDK